MMQETTTLVTPKERLLYFLSEIGLSMNACEKNLGLSKGFLSNKTAEFSTESIRKFSEYFPELDIMWLIFGDNPPKHKVGDTIENNAGSVVNRSQISSEVMQALSHSQEAIIGQLAVKDAQIAAQQNTINDLLAFINASGINK